MQFKYRSLCCHIIIAYHNFNGTQEVFTGFQDKHCKDCRPSYMWGKENPRKEKGTGESAITNLMNPGFEPNIDVEQEKEFTNHWHNNEPIIVHI